MHPNTCESWSSISSTIPQRFQKRRDPPPLKQEPILYFGVKQLIYTTSSCNDVLSELRQYGSKPTFLDRHVMVSMLLNWFRWSLK